MRKYYTRACNFYHGSDATIYQGMFIGMRDDPSGTTVNSDWRWIDGSDADYSNWGPDEPNNGCAAWT